MLHSQVSPPTFQGISQVPKGVQVRLASPPLLLLLLAGVLLLLLRPSLLLQGSNLATLCCPSCPHHGLLCSISSICTLLLL
jgi:hypothetical protein